MEELKQKNEIPRVENIREVEFYFEQRRPAAVTLKNNTSTYTKSLLHLNLDFYTSGLSRVPSDLEENDVVTRKQIKSSNLTKKKFDVNPFSTAYLSSEISNRDFSLSKTHDKRKMWKPIDELDNDHDSNQG